MKVYIGYDNKEAKACEVARRTLKRTSGMSCEFLDIARLHSTGLITRSTDARGRTYDFVSQAHQATSFAISRFLTPLLCQGGWALYTDCDVVFLSDVYSLMSAADSRFAIQVVKHQYTPVDDVKMVDQAQTTYARKNWSSVMLFNCEHPANQRLTLHDVNNRTGLYLHQFGWLNDSEIGDLPPAWNWLVGAQPMPAMPHIAHFTEGGPWLENWLPHEHDEIWLDAASS